MKTNALLFFLGSILILGCSNEPRIINPIDNKIEIKIDVNDNDRFFEFNKFITDSVSFVQLETSEESLFGQASKIKVDNKKVYILGLAERSLSIFNLNSGKFLSKIRYPKGQDIRDFFVRGDTIATLNYHKIIKYSNTNFKVLSETSFEDTELKKSNPVNFAYYSDNFFYTWNNKENPLDGSDCFLKKYVNGVNIESYVPHSTGYKSAGISKFCTAYSNEIYFSPAVNILDIYKISRDTVSIVASIKIKNAISSEFLEPIKNSPKYSSLVLENDFYKDINNIVKLNADLIYFECIGPQSYWYSGVFSLKNKKILEFGKRDFFHSPIPFYSDGKYLYAYYEPSQVLRLQSEGKPTNIFYRQIANAQIKTLKTNNLIITKIKINEKL